MTALAPTLLLLIGLPGSGKSTLAAQLAASGCRVISTDQIRARLFGDEAIQGDWGQIWRSLQHDFTTAALALRQEAGGLAVYDATNAVRRQRRQVIQLAADCGFEQILGVWLDVPLAVCLQRNQRRDRQVPDEVIQQMHRRLQGAPPDSAEGLAAVIRLSPSALSGDLPMGALTDSLVSPANLLHWRQRA